MQPRRKKTSRNTQETGSTEEVTKARRIEKKKGKSFDQFMKLDFGVTFLIPFFLHSSSFFFNSRVSIPFQTAREVHMNLTSAFGISHRKSPFRHHRRRLRQPPMSLHYKSEKHAEVYCLFTQIDLFSLMNPRHRHPLGLCVWEYFFSQQ